MKSIGRNLLLASTVITFAGVVPASLATAAADVTGSVRAIAERAADVVVEEQDLLLISTGSDLTSAERAALETRIEDVDTLGAELLDQLDRLDVELSQATRISLGRLAPAADRLLQPAVYVPAAAVYDAATADLARIAQTPESVTNAPTESSSPAFGLLAVAALSLLVLGAAALGNSLRREPDPSESDGATWNDELTGLANRRKLDVDLDRDGAVATTAILVDIDQLQRINETFGPVVGDEVLRRVSTLISQNVRYDDVVYRYGGEEFCVLLPGATIEDADRIADRIVDAAYDLHLPDGRTVSVSVGVAGVCDDAMDAVQRADRALDAAKERRRERAVA